MRRGRSHPRAGTGARANDVTDSPVGESNARATIYTFLRGDGSRYFVYTTRAAKVPLHVVPPSRGIVIKLKKNQKRPGETAWLHVVDELTARGVIREGDYVFTDNESSLRTEAGMDMFEDRGVHRGFFPTYLGSLMNPCDNAFHSPLKRRYNQAIGTFEKPSEHNKITTTLEAFYSVSAASIKKYFDHVGLTRGRPAAVIDRLLGEGRRFSSEWRPVHEAQLEAYRAWLQDHDEITFEGDDDEPVEEQQRAELDQIRRKRTRRNVK